MTGRILHAARFSAAEERLRQGPEASRAISASDAGMRRFTVEYPDKFKRCFIFDVPVRPGEYICSGYSAKLYLGGKSSDDGRRAVYFFKHFSAILRILS